MLFSRSLLYTGITRAEKLVILVGREDVLRFMVENNYKSVRYTGLKNMFAEVQNETLASKGIVYDEENTANDIETDEFAVIDWNDVLDF